MKIKFKKKYDDDTQWHRILLDFLYYIGEEYYPDDGLDAYDLLGIVWQERQMQIADLVNKGNKPAINQFMHLCEYSNRWHKKANGLREDYRKTLEALMPKKKGFDRELEEGIEEGLNEALDGVTYELEITPEMKDLLYEDSED